MRAVRADLAPEEHSAIEVQVDDVFASSEVAQPLATVDDVTVVDWQDENEELLSGLAAQSGSSLHTSCSVPSTGTSAPAHTSSPTTSPWRR